MRLSSDPTPQQQQILVLLAEGKTINAAAAAVGVHRNTIANWRRSSESFRNHWHIMQYEQTMHWRDEMQSLAQIAVDAVLKTLTDEKTPPGVRLRAALAVLNKVTELPPNQPGLHISQTAHNSAQPAHPPREDESVSADLDADLDLDLEADLSHTAAAQAAQSCTTSLTDLHEDLLHLDDDGIADLLEHMCTPPRTHNLAQAMSPDENRSAPLRPGSRDSS